METKTKYTDLEISEMLKLDFPAFQQQLEKNVVLRIVEAEKIKKSNIPLIRNSANLTRLHESYCK